MWSFYELKISLHRNRVAEDYIIQRGKTYATDSRNVIFSLSMNEQIDLLREISNKKIKVTIFDDDSNDSYIIQISLGQPPILTANIKSFVIISNI